jgi:flagellar transcriptional activator FlhD
MEYRVETDKDSVAANYDEISREIGDINLAYMLLAQKMVKQDKAASMIRLGIGSELADMLANMSIAQVIKLANSKFLLFGPRLDDQASICAVGSEEKDSALQRAHMSILMAAQNYPVKRRA